MSRITAQQAGGPQICAFADMLALSEMGSTLLAKSDDGYNVLVGSTVDKPVLISDYSKHPRRMVKVRYHNFKTGEVEEVNSSAFGRYQYIWPTWRDTSVKAGVTDITPVSQDRVLIQTLHDVHAYDVILEGRIRDAMILCNPVWASLPGAGSGQHENKLTDLLYAYDHALSHYVVGTVPNFSNVIAGVTSTAQGVTA